MPNFTTLLTTLYKKHDSYKEAISAIEFEIIKNCDFEATIEWQTDGFIVVDEDENNSLLTDCIKEIKKNGFLTHEAYLNYCI